VEAPVERTCSEDLFQGDMAPTRLSNDPDATVAVTTPTDVSLLYLQEGERKQLGEEVKGAKVAAKKAIAAADKATQQLAAERTRADAAEEAVKAAAATAAAREQQVRERERERERERQDLGTWGARQGGAEKPNVLCWTVLWLAGRVDTPRRRRRRWSNFRRIARRRQRRWRACVWWRRARRVRRRCCGRQ
jgi:hypothetical protein